MRPLFLRTAGLAALACTVIAADTPAPAADAAPAGDPKVPVLKISFDEGTVKDGATVTATGRSAPAEGYSLAVSTGKLETGPGVVGNAVRFDGKTVLKFADAAAANMAGKNVSVALWIKAEGDFEKHKVGEQIILEKAGWCGRGGPADLYQLTLPKTGTFYFSYSSAKSARPEAVLDYAKGAKWIHLATTYDVAGRMVVLYKDGKPVGADTIGGEGITKPKDGGNGGPLWIGARSCKDKLANSFNGWMDELVVTDQVLTPEEVKALYDAGAAKAGG